MKHADKIRADFEADPEAKHRMEEAFRKMRPNILRATALHETIFPPESPTSRRRGGNKLAPSPQFMDAVCFILDARMGFEYELAQSDFDKAMKNADPQFFRMMADAAQYVRDMPHADSLFAKHVIIARVITANMMGEDVALPSWREVREEVSDQLGQAAYGETSRDWGRVRKVASLSDLPD